MGFREIIGLFDLIATVIFIYALWFYKRPKFATEVIVSGFDLKNHPHIFKNNYVKDSIKMYINGIRQTNNFDLIAQVSKNEIIISSISKDDTIVLDYEIKK